MEPHQANFVAEKQQLDDKLAALEAFGRTDTYAALSADARSLLCRKCTIMHEYSCILGECIAKFA